MAHRPDRFLRRNWSGTTHIIEYIIMLEAIVELPVYELHE